MQTTVCTLQNICLYGNVIMLLKFSHQRLKWYIITSYTSKTFTLPCKTKCLCSAYVFVDSTADKEKRFESMLNCCTLKVNSDHFQFRNCFFC